MTRYFSTLFSLSIISIFVFPSCEQVLETDIGSAEQKLVMVSNFSADHQLEVLVTSTRSVISNSSGTDYVTNAVVKVFEGTEFLEELILQMPDDGSNLPPSYVSVDFRPKVGSTYTLKASAPGFISVQASNIIPRGTNVGEVGFTNTLNVKDTAIADVNFNVSLNFQDDPDEENYYHILFYQQLLRYSVSERPDGGFDTIALASSDFAELEVDLMDGQIPYTKFLGGQSILLKDDSFAGQNVDLRIKGSFSFDIDQHLPGSFSVEIRTVSEAYYLYYTTLTNQGQGNNELLADTQPVFDNVENGNGIFAGYSSNTTFFAINP